MGGGIAGHELAAAVSEAGGLGTLGIVGPQALADELRAARERTSRPLAVNLLLPFARGGHWQAARDADAVVTFWGRPARRTDGVWLHQCGSVDEALAARSAGADAVIVQGVEAGGHVRGTTPALRLLERTRAALPPGYPVLAAGAMAEAGDVSRALEAGADAAVLGTRFLMTRESGAHPLYKQRLVEGSDTVLTELFGLGWAGPHRVLPNEATRRWLRGDPRGPSWLRSFNRLTAPAIARLPESLAARALAAQRPELVEATPLYAGESVARIGDLRPAGDLTRELAPD
jgi:NAD(P)H-dependent flavin oxidoreductase YrpB (nitropropane dioxygenase family)